MSTPKKQKVTPSTAEDEALVSSLCSKLRKILNQKNAVLEEVQGELSSLKDKLLASVKPDLTRHLFVKLVPKECDIKAIREMFGDCGVVIHVDLVVDFNSRSFVVYFNESKSVLVALQKHKENPFCFNNLQFIVIARRENLQKQIIPVRSDALKFSSLIPARCQCHQSFHSGFSTGSCDRLIGFSCGGMCFMKFVG